MKKPILAALALCYALGAAAQTPDTAAPEGYRFTDVKIMPVTPVKDQSRSGTCWCFSTLSFLESEIIKAGGEPMHLSEMWIVRHSFMDKAEKYVRMHGTLNFAEGGAAHDVTEGIREHRDLAPGVRSHLAFEPRSGVARAIHCTIDIIHDEVQMYRRPVTRVRAQVPAGAGGNGTIGFCEQENRRGGAH